MNWVLWDVSGWWSCQAGAGVVRKRRRELLSTTCRIDSRYIPPNAIHLDSFWQPPHCPLRPFCRSVATLFYVVCDSLYTDAHLFVRFSTISRTHTRTQSLLMLYSLGHSLNSGVSSSTDVCSRSRTNRKSYVHTPTYAVLGSC